MSLARVEIGKYDAWLFDLDGTLVDTAPDLHGALAVTLDAFGHGPCDEARVRDWVGAGARVTIEQALRHQSVEHDDACLDRMLEHFLDHYRAHIADRSVIYPGIETTLAWLQHRGLGAGVVTNKYEDLSISLIEALAIDHLFGTIIGGDTLPVRKPDPAPLLEACRRLGCEPARTLMVGDSKTDVDAARNAGIDVVCVSYGYHGVHPPHSLGADLVVDSVADLLPARRAGSLCRNSPGEFDGVSR